MEKEKTCEERIGELITVELLSEVLGILKPESFYIVENCIFYMPKGCTILSSKEKENIDTFCFKCKKWLSKNDCDTDSGYTANNKKSLAEIYNHGKKFYAETEQEAIIKATLWVQEQVKGDVS